MTRESGDTVPAGALVEPLDYRLNGSFAGCQYSQTSFALTRGSLELISGFPSTTTPARAQATYLVEPGSSTMRFKVHCVNSDGGFGTVPGSLPTFTASLTFQWTVKDKTPTRSFN